MRNLPGGPAEFLLGEAASQKAVNALNHDLGLNQTFVQQYFYYLKGYMSGDWGVSLFYDQDNLELVLDGAKVTLGFSFLTILISTFLTLIYMLLRIALSAKRRRRLELTYEFLFSVPGFIWAILVLSLFFQYIYIGDNWRATVWAAVSAAFPVSIYLSLFVSKEFLEQEVKPYVLVLKAKGLSDLVIYLKHVLSASIVPVVSSFILIFADLLVGSILFESVFNLPGVGRLLFQAFSNRDFPLAYAVIVWVSLVYSLAMAVFWIFNVKKESQYEASV